MAPFTYTVTKFCEVTQTSEGLKVEQYKTSAKYSLEYPTFCCCQPPQATGSFFKI